MQVYNFAKIIGVRVRLLFFFRIFFIVLGAAEVRRFVYWPVVRGLFVFIN